MTKYELEDMIEAKETELEILKKQLRDIEKEEAKKELSEVKRILLDKEHYVHIYDDCGNEFNIFEIYLATDGTLEICIE